MDTTEMEYVSWYEASLPLRERKQRGHFSTPPLLVERILDACGYSPENDLSHLRVLDPACGSGNFLAGAARRLTAFAVRAGLSQSEIAALAAHNLWGIDPDPVSCLLAEMNVRAQYHSCKDGNSDGRRRADKSAVGTINRPLRNVPEVLLNVHDSASVDVGLDIPARLHIHQADGLALPWDGYEGIDLFLANPPYLAAKNTDLSSYRSTRGSGQLDSYLLFLDLALSVVQPGGWLGLVLPDPVLARSNASRQRARLLETCTIFHLWHLSGVFAASVGAVVLIAQKWPAPATHLISWERASWSRGSLRQVEPDVQGGRQEQQREALNSVPQSLFRRQPNAELRYLLSSERGALIERLRSHLEHANGSERRLAPLSDFLTIRRGEELGRTSAKLVRPHPPGRPQGSPLLYTSPPHPPHHCSLAQRASGDVYGRGDPCGRPGGRWSGDCPGVAGRPNEGDYFPVLLGGVDVKPYGTPVGSCWLAGEAVEKPLERYLAPKLLVVKSTGQLQAALDVNGHVVLQTLYLLHVRSEDGEVGEVDEAGEDVDALYFFLALLNSRLLREYVYVLHTAYKWVQPQIEQHVLACLPVPLAGAAEKREVIERARRLTGLLELPSAMGQEEICSEAGAVVELKQQWQGLYEEQERAIDALYAAALPEIS